MTRSLRRVVSLTFALWVVGCASQDATVTQTIRVETPGCTKASCVLANDRGTWRLSRAPGEVTVIVSSRPLKAVCVAEGAGESSAGTPATLAPQGHQGAAVGLTVGTAAGIALGSAALAIIPPLGIMAIMTGASMGLAGGSAIDANVHAYSYPDVIRIEAACGAQTDTADAAASRGPRIGVAIRGMTAEEGRAAGLGDRGAVFVTGVGEGGLAAAAGLRVADIVIAANGRPIADADDLEQLVLGLRTGGPLQLQVWREGRSLDLSVALPKVAP